MSTLGKRVIQQLIFLFSIFCFSCTTTPNEQTWVAIQPMGRYNASLTKSLRQAIAQYYGVKVTINPHQPIPKNHFINRKSPRYRADSIIHYLRETKPAHIDYVLGFTDSDVSTTKTDNWGRVLAPAEKYTDWGVMGLAYLSGPSGVVSTYRLRGNAGKVEQRVKKVTLHEVGHLFGLPHCPDKQCFMTDAVESIRTVDQASMDLCTACKKKIGLIR